MSDEGCRKASMYVITEKGLEVGPFVYNKDTDSRVVCANKRYIYNNHKGNDSRIVGDVNFHSHKGLLQQKKIKIVDLGADSLPSDGLSNEFINHHVRDFENWGLRSGNFRSKNGLKSGKIRLCSAGSSNLESCSREDKDLDLEAIKRLLQSKKELEEMAKKISNPRKDFELSLSGKRQLILRRLRIKRQSEVLLEEIERLRGKVAAQLGEHEQGKDVGRKDYLKTNRNVSWLRHLIDPHLNARSNNNERCDQKVQLPSIQPPAICASKHSEATQKSSEKDTFLSSHLSQKQNIFPPKKKNKGDGQKLVFLNPRVQYRQSEAESLAKSNINQCKVNNAKPKVRLPAVIDQRTGEMHSVPGVVAFRQSDYNQWSRRTNIIRREALPTRSPSLTYVNFLPSVAGENK